MTHWLSFSREESSIEEEFNSKLREVYDRDGLKGLNEHVTSELDRWKHKKINIAVTGNSGAGKSSLINGLRGIDEHDENAAKEGVTCTTKERKAYPFTSNEQIILYDLPGVGTRSHPIEKFTIEMDFQQYHFVVIVSGPRLTEIDAMLIKELQRLNKPFFLVISKIGRDVYNLRKTQTREEVLDQIRKDCLSTLHELDVKGNDVFLVDSHDHHAFELGKLQISIANNAPEALKASLILSYGNISKEVIEGKIEYFKGRLMSVAIKAVLSALPGAGYLMKADFITNEITFYKEGLGLDDASLIKTYDILGLDVKEMKNIISSTDLESFEDDIIKMLQDDKLGFRQ